MAAVDREASKLVQLFNRTHGSIVRTVLECSLGYVPQHRSSLLRRNRVFFTQLVLLHPHGSRNLREVFAVEHLGCSSSREAEPSSSSRFCLPTRSFRVVPNKSRLHLSYASLFISNESTRRLHQLLAIFLRPAYPFFFFSHPLSASSLNNLRATSSECGACPASSRSSVFMIRQRR